MVTRNRTTSTPAPIGGLNVRDAINSMPTSDAIELVNWIPQQYGVRSRKGWKEWAINFPATVKSIMEYQPNRENLATAKLFAATDAQIYDITASTNAPSSSFTLPGTDDYGYFSHTQFANSAGNFLLACSHQGGYFIYDGSTWTQAATSGPGYHIAGIDPADLVFVTQWKQRLWFVEKDSTSVWYMSAVDAISGSVSELDVGPFTKHGGKVSFIANWTIDAGEGIDDLLVIATENGEVLIYKGTNPASASDFSLVGVYYIGALPVGRRAFATLGGDLLIMTELGIQPISYVTRGGQSLLRASAVDYLGKVQPRFQELVAQFPNTMGWSLDYYPRESLLIVTVPPGAAEQFRQYALYTGTNGWCEFLGIPSNGTWGISAGNIYFATNDGRVCQGLTGFFDDVPYGETIGNGIYGKIQPSYNYFGALGANKHWLLVRPTFLATDRPDVVCTMLADFQFRPAVGTPVASAPSGSLWDVSLWDEGVWGGNLNSYQDWYSVEALGYAGSLVIDTTCPGDTFLASIDYVFEIGGTL